MPLIGQLSNVSGLVLPETLPVADDEQMGSRDELIHRLLDVVELQARALHGRAAQQSLDGELLRQLQNDPAGLRDFYDQAIGTYQPPKPKRPGHRPNEKEMRVWSAFRERYQKLERSIRVDRQLKPDAELTKETMEANGGEHPKSMTSHMLWHGLDAEQWPPSTWPEESPLPPA